MARMMMSLKLYEEHRTRQTVAQSRCHQIQKKGELSGHKWKECPWKDQTFVWISHTRREVMDRKEGMRAGKSKMKVTDKSQKPDVTCSSWGCGYK